MDQHGYYSKYQVTRADGTPVEGRTFTIEIDKDPDAPEIVAALASLYTVSRPQLAEDLTKLASELFDDETLIALPTYAQRIVHEAALLEDKLSKLADFNGSSAFSELSIPQRGLLMAQEELMRAYVNVLQSRLVLIFADQESSVE